MRLGQLARKLSLRPSQLVDFLAENNIPSEEGSNTKLADPHTEMIVKHFAPESLEEIMNPAVQEIVQAEITVVEDLVTSLGPEGKIEEPVAALEESVETNETPAEQPAESDVIRVQKVELSGLKVLGKIDLPEPKKKEPKAEGESSSTDEKPERKGRNSRSKQPRAERTQPREWRNPLDAQRKREARELEERKKAELEREKERKKNHYHSKVKQVQRPKKDKALKEPVVAKKPVDKRPAPKTLIGKFLRWWTT